MQVTCAQRIIGTIGISFVHLCLFLLIIGYVYIVSSTEKNNLFHVAYEPSGMQMLYYYFTLPVFIFLSWMSYVNCLILHIQKHNVQIILLIWFMFWIFIVFLNEVLHFPRNKLLYHGSLLIALISVTLTIWSIISQIQEVRKLKSI